ncbi:hypothetical protein AVEN_71566-1 [Araneus ventricosus]|uniref:Uncharacterized protein n=1 Tax=Araneus ventricosus TaxID=182803 RepID=A0A4Y1ZNH7_ARAVE|nr:hypothetical protein AVEN_71566-1 [Araneus ventricosus]
MYLCRFEIENTLELKRRSVDVASPYSTFCSVSRSRTTPNMQNGSGTDHDSSGDSGLLMLPPPPPSAHRPLSTFIDTNAKNMDSLQVMASYLSCSCLSLLHCSSSTRDFHILSISF